MCQNVYCAGRPYDRGKLGEYGLICDNFAGNLSQSLTWGMTGQEKMVSGRRSYILNHLTYRSLAMLGAGAVRLSVRPPVTRPA